MRQPFLAMVGLAVIAFLCVQLLRGAVTLEAAAMRAVTLTVVLAVADRLLVPLGRALMGEPRAAQPALPTKDEEAEAWSA